MRLIEEKKLNFEDVLIVPQRTILQSRKDVLLEREFQFYHSPRKWRGIPIMSANMHPLGNMGVYNVLSKFKMITVLHKYYSTEELVNLYAGDTQKDYLWCSIGKSNYDLQKIKDLNFSPNIVLDVPNGYMQEFVRFAAKVREAFPESIICAGNVCTPEMTQELIIHGGVDIVKAQIGPGRFCRTRMVTGIGYPTFSCCVECSSVSHGLKSGERKMGLVCSDGGCTNSGDVCKALCAGSDFVMLGSLFAGCSECEGMWEYEKDPSVHPVVSKEGEVFWKDSDRKKSLRFYGMSTHLAQEIHGEGKKEYRASEGSIEQVPHKGPLSNIVKEILGGIRSCCTYIGASSIKDMNKCAVFCKTNSVHQMSGF